MDNLGTFGFNNLFGGSEKDRVHEPGTMIVGELLPIGAVVAKVTSTGKWKEARLADLADYARLGLTSSVVDSTAGEINASFYVEGEFNQNGVTFYYGSTADDWRDVLENHGIYLRKSISPAGV